MSTLVQPIASGLGSEHELRSCAPDQTPVSVMARVLKCSGKDKEWLALQSAPGRHLKGSSIFTQPGPFPTPLFRLALSRGVQFPVYRSLQCPGRNKQQFRNKHCREEMSTSKHKSFLKDEVAPLL